MECRSACALAAIQHLVQLLVRTHRAPCMCHNKNMTVPQASSYCIPPTLRLLYDVHDVIAVQTIDLMLDHSAIGWTQRARVSTHIARHGDTEPVAPFSTVSPAGDGCSTLLMPSSMSMLWYLITGNCEAMKCLLDDSREQAGPPHHATRAGLPL